MKLFLIFLFFNPFSPVDDGIRDISKIRQFYFQSKQDQYLYNIPEGEGTQTFSITGDLNNRVAIKLEDAEVKEEDQREEKIDLAPYVIAGIVSDNYGFKNRFLSGLGAGIRYYLSSSFFMNAGFNYTFYPERYYFITRESRLNVQTGTEHKLKMDSHAGFLVLNTEHLKIFPIAGISLDALILSDATNLIFGPSGGLTINVGVFKDLKLKILTTFTYDVLKDSNTKPVGGFPLGFIDYSFYIEIKRIFFGYTGEYLLYPDFEMIDNSGHVTKYTKNSRFYNLLAFGINL